MVEDDNDIDGDNADDDDDDEWLVRRPGGRSTNGPAALDDQREKTTLGIDGDDDDDDFDDDRDDRDSDDMNEANDLSLFATLPDVELLAHHHHRPQGGATGHMYKHTQSHISTQAHTEAYSITNTRRVIWQHNRRYP